MSGISDVLFEGNTVQKAGLAIKLSSRLGMGGRLSNITFQNTEVVEAGITVNVDMAVSSPLTPGAGSRGPGTDPALLSRVEGLSIINLTAVRGGYCGPDVTHGAYCGGAGCLQGNALVALHAIRLVNVTIAESGAGGTTPIGWLCRNVSADMVEEAVLPPVCAGPANFACSET